MIVSNPPMLAQSLDGRRILITVLGLLLLCTLAAAVPPPETYYYYDFTSDANISRDIGINISDGEAKLDRVQPNPAFNTTTDACGQDTSFFIEYNNSANGTPNPNPSCMRAKNNKYAPVNGTSLTIDKAWMTEPSLFGEALRLRNDSVGGRICYEAQGPIYTESWQNDLYYGLWFKLYNDTATSNLAIFDFKGWSLKTGATKELLFYISRGPDGSGSYNRAWPLGVSTTDLTDGQYHHLEVLRTNYSDKHEVGVFLDGDLRLYVQGESLHPAAYGGTSAGTGFCLGSPGLDLALDQVLIKNGTALINNSWNRTNYYRDTNASPYTTMMGILVLNPINISDGTWDPNSPIRINATYTYPNNSNGTKILITGYFGNNASLQDAWVRNGTISFVQDACGIGANTNFYNTEYGRFLDHNVTLSCTVSGDAYNTTATDNLSSYGNDVGIEDTASQLATLATSRWVRNLVRGYASHTFTSYSGLYTQADINAVTPHGYTFLTTTTGGAGQYNAKRVVTHLNCGSTCTAGTTCLGCLQNISRNASYYNNWQIVASHWTDNLGAVFDGWLNYTTQTATPGGTDALAQHRVEVLSVRAAQQKWWPELNSSGIVMDNNRTSANFTPVIIFLSDGQNTPSLQSLNISQGSPAAGGSGTAPTIAWTSPTPNLTGTDELHAYTNITLNTSITFGSDESSKLTYLNFTWNGTTVPLIEPPNTTNDTGLVLYADFDQNVSVAADEDRSRFNVTDQSGKDNNLTAFQYNFTGTDTLYNDSYHQPISWDPQGYISFHGGRNYTKYLGTKNNTATGFRINGSTVTMWLNRTNNWSFPSAYNSSGLNFNGSEVLFHATTGNERGFYVRLDRQNIILTTWNESTFGFDCVYSIPPQLLNSSDTWHFVGVSLNSSDATNTTNATVYFDNYKLSINTTWQCNIWWGKNPFTTLQFGGDTRAQEWRVWNGSIDEIRVYNRTLSQKELELLSHVRMTHTNNGGYNLTGNWTNQTNGTYTYSLFAQTSGGNTTSTGPRFFVQPKRTNVTLNTILSIKVIENLIGTNVHKNWVSNKTNIYNSSTAKTSNASWHNETMLNSGISVLRADASIDNYLFDLPNKGAEYWNYSRWTDVGIPGGETPAPPINNSYLSNVPQGWTFSLYSSAGNASGQITNYSRANSGKQAVMICANTTTTGSAYNSINLYWPAGHNYTLEVMMKTWTAGKGQLFIQDTSDSYNGNSTLDTFGDGFYHNITLHSGTITFKTTQDLYRIAIAINGPNQCAAWDDVRLYQDGKEYWPPPISDNNKSIAINEWAYANNKTVMWIPSYMPVALANINTTCSNMGNRCPPHNLTEWSLWLRRWYNLTTNNGQYVNNTMLEIWNEPDTTGFWMGLTPIGSTDRVTQYLRLYNASYDGIKADWPYAKIGGPATTEGNYDDFFGNFTKNGRAGADPQKYDFLTYHIYSNVGEDHVTRYRNNITNLYAKCVSAGATCNPLYISESNSHDPSQLVNQSAWLYAQYAASFMWTMYQSTHNITQIFYQWSDARNYSLDGGPTSYDEYPHRFSMVSEAGLDAPDAELYASYNVTRWFNQLFPPDSVVVNTTSTNARTFVVGGVNGTKKYLVISNTDEVPVTVSVSSPVGVDSPLALTDLQSGAVYSYSPTRGLFDNITVDSNGVAYLELSSSLRWTTLTNTTTNNSVQITGTTPTPVNVSATWGYSAANHPYRVNWSLTDNTSYYQNLSSQYASTMIFVNLTICDASECNLTSVNLSTKSNNHVPTIVGASLAPNPAYKTDAFLSGTWTYGDSDGDAAGTTLLLWYRNQSVVLNTTSSNATPTLDNSHYAQGDTITLSILGNDSQELSSSWVNTSLTISNSVPTLTSAAVTPVIGTKASTYVCTATGTDADADPLTYQYDWYDTDNVTVLQTGTNGSYECRNAAACTRNDSLTCVATATDGLATSDALTDNSSVNNTAPQAILLNLTPNPADTTNNLTCNFTYYDLDGDTINASTITWWVNGTTNATLGPNTTAGTPTNTSLSLDADNTATTDIWGCEALVQDDITNGTKTNSSTIILGSTGPSVTTTDPTPIVDINTNYTVNWTWTSGAANPHTHYLCNSTDDVLTGCGGGETYCVLDDDTSPSSCNFTTNATMNHLQNVYLLIRGGGGENSTWTTIPLHVNHPPNSSNLSLNVNTTSGGINKYNCTLTGTSDTDADSTTIYYTFALTNNTILQAESTTNTYDSASGYGSHGDAVQCRARAYDQRLYGPTLNSTNHTRIATPTLSAGTSSSALTQSFTVYNTSGLTSLNLSLRDPLNVVYSGLSATYTGGTTWTYTYTPLQIGTWTLVSATATQPDDQGYTYVGSGDTYTVGAASSGGAGGGATPEPIIVTVPTANQTTTTLCGNGVCEVGEDENTCNKDCHPNLDSIFTCVFKNPLDCKWVPTIVTWVVVGIALFALSTEFLTKNKKRKHAWT